MITYRATNTLNGKFYIGSTIRDFKKRKKEHLRSKFDWPFQNALRKNPEAFVWEVWEDDENEPLLEQKLLDWWYGGERCYNLTGVAGGFSSDLCRKSALRGVELKVGFHDPEVREKVRKRLSKQILILFPNGEERVFASLNEATQSTGIPRSSLSRWAHGVGVSISGIAVAYLDEVINSPILNPYKHYGYHPAASPWRITFADGKVVEITGLAGWARENKYDENKLRAVSKGRRKTHKNVVSVEKLEVTKQ
jgi:hypothetical protein